MKTIIVGGGISGLYLAYQLLKKHPNQKVEVIEGSSRLGGRIYTQHDGLFEMGAKRISEKHHKTVELLKELGLGSRLDFKNKKQANESYYVSGKHCDTVKACFGRDLYKVLKTLYETNKSPTMYRKSTHDWLLQHGMSRDTMNQIKTIYGFTAEFKKSNAAEGIPYILSLLNPNTKFTECLGGLSQGISSLAKKLYRYPNFSAKVDTYIDQAEYDKDTTRQFQVSSDGNVVSRGHRLVFALPPQAINSINMVGFPDWNKKAQRFQQKTPTRLLRVYGEFHKKNLFRDCPPVMTDLPLTSIEPIENGNSKKSYAMITYCDEEKVSKIVDLLDSGRYQKLARKWLKQIYPVLKNRLTPDIKLDTFYYDWDPAGYYTLPGVNHQKLNKVLRIPYENNREIPFFLVGDTYSSLPIWIEGSLSSVGHVIRYIEKSHKHHKKRKTDSIRKQEKKEKVKKRGLKYDIKILLDDLYKNKCQNKMTTKSIFDSPEKEWLLVLGGYVLNIKGFLNAHPGGEAVLRGAGTGEDWTHKFSKVGAHQGKIERMRGFIEKHITCVGKFVKK